MSDSTPVANRRFQFRLRFGFQFCEPSVHLTLNLANKFKHPRNGQKSDVATIDKALCVGVPKVRSAHWVEAQPQQRK